MGFTKSWCSAVFYAETSIKHESENSIRVLERRQPNSFRSDQLASSAYGEGWGEYKRGGSFESVVANSAPQRLHKRRDINMHISLPILERSSSQRICDTMTEILFLFRPSNENIVKIRPNFFILYIYIFNLYTVFIRL